jgi:hypothetical protein
MLSFDCNDSVDEAKRSMGGVYALIFCASLGTILPISEPTF